MIYFIRAESGIVKIGYTSRKPEQRLKELQRTSSERLEMVCAIKGDIVLERKLHEQFKEYNVYGEWFNLPREELSHFVELSNRETEDSLERVSVNSKFIHRKIDITERLVLDLRDHFFKLIDNMDRIYSKSQVKNAFNDALFTVVCNLMEEGVL